MKPKNSLIYLILGLLIISLDLSAENAEGRFRLNEGDWFEMQLSIPYNFRLKKPSPISLYAETNQSNIKLKIQYQLMQQLSNGNQIYQATYKRIEGRLKGEGINDSNIWLGYDSYYPPFKDNLVKKQLATFEIEVTPTGRIISFESVSGTNPLIQFRRITPSNIVGGTYSVNIELGPALIENFTAFMMFKPSKSMDKIIFNDSDEEIKVKTLNENETEHYFDYQFILNDSVLLDNRFLKNENVPLSNNTFKLVNASFPIPENTLIHGELKEFANQNITISIDGDDDEKYFTKKFFKVHSDGTFNCPLFLERPFNFRLQIGDKKLNVFLEPNDTLEILSLPQKIRRYDYPAVFKHESIPPGHLYSSENFKGNAAYNAKLSVEMDEWIRLLQPETDDKATYENFKITLIERTNELLKIYEDKVSESCIRYFRSTRDQFIALFKLNLYKFKPHVLSEQSKNGLVFPANFLLEVDTIQTLMYPFEWSNFYQEYNKEAFEFKKQRLEMSVGGKNNEFYSNYYFARASLEGFPLYSFLYKELDKELRKGYKQSKRIEPFYQDFINNCNDPIFTEPLKMVHDYFLKLQVGNSFPIQSFRLKDSTEFNLSEFNKRPLCLIFMYAHKNIDDSYKKEIEKFDEDEVDFLFVLIPDADFTEVHVDSSLLSKPNVKVIEALDRDLRDKMLISEGATKIFMLDKWLRIVVDDVLNPEHHIGFTSFEDAVKKASETKRFSEQQKASFFKIAGWSLGSILFTLLVGLWIYRVRVRNLKKREAIKRQIKELEIKAIRSQMNPHFVFNALNSIQSLVNSNQYKETNIYLAKFSVLLRGVLNNSEKSRVSLSDELEAVKLYCELEQLRFEFELKFDVDPVLDSDLIEIPGMIIQPLAENAVVHGLAPLGKNGLLQISINQCTEGLCVTVSDNGVGLPDRTEDKLREKGYGLKLVEERIAILSKKDKKARLKLEKNRDGQGTIATLIIPIDNV